MLAKNKHARRRVRRTQADRALSLLKQAAPLLAQNEMMSLLFEDGTLQEQIAEAAKAGQHITLGTGCPVCLTPIAVGRVRRVLLSVVLGPQHHAFMKRNYPQAYLRPQVVAPGAQLPGQVGS